MKRFDYASTLSSLMTPEVMNVVSGIHEYYGKQDLYLSTERRCGQFLDLSLPFALTLLLDLSPFLALRPPLAPYAARVLGSPSSALLPSIVR